MESLTVKDALLTRKSIRAFLDKPVEHGLIEKILILAGNAPSGANIQPWKVRVLTGASLKNFGTLLSDVCISGEEPDPEYPYYPNVWNEPYLTRRRTVGWQLYNSVGITRGEKEKMLHQQAHNFVFFDAPVGFIFTMDNTMSIGSMLDVGMFMQSIMIAARFYGLDTCTQAAFIEYPRHVRDFLNISADEKLLCGMALGFRDPNAPINQFKAEREQFDKYVHFV